MSLEFVQVKCEHVKSDPSTYKIIAPLDVYHDPRVALMLPRIDGNYNKRLTECAVNLLEQCASSLKYNKPDMNSNKTEHDIDRELQSIVKDLAGTLQYIVNSSSWRNGEYHGFDRFEIDKRLRRLGGTHD